MVEKAKSDRIHRIYGIAETEQNPVNPVNPVRIGVSSCLLGMKVRYDGGHKDDSFVHQTLAPYVQFVPVCPEVEIGLGTPRETIRLEGDPSDPRLVAPKSGTDLTETMKAYAGRRVEELAALGLHGYILKKDSPSCGMERVRVHQTTSGSPARVGTGLFAAALMARFPSLPVEEEGRLNDPVLRENFIERVFAFYRLQHFLGSTPSTADLVEFHSRSKMALLAHSPKHYKQLGQLVASPSKALITSLDAYGRLLMEALRVKATRRKHVNALQHLAGYLKKVLDSEDRAEIVATIEDYRQGLVPLVVPLTLLKHHFRRHPDPWVLNQTYLNPYPAELMLRNHV
ncbi:MAG: DUF1722 domain-containing protein [Acidobacteria bacterium]|nr:MAG: DUF1722 domain-containing protein [Acidobacteriota bacterium]